jgi:hypothetical protein
MANPICLLFGYDGLNLVVKGWRPEVWDGLADAAMTFHQETKAIDPFREIAATAKKRDTDQVSSLYELVHYS